MEVNLAKLEEKLLDRNFPKALIDEKFEIAKKKDRKNISKRQPKNQSKDKVRGVLHTNKETPPFNNGLESIKNSLLKMMRLRYWGTKSKLDGDSPKI